MIALQLLQEEVFDCFVKVFMFEPSNEVGSEIAYTKENSASLGSLGGGVNQKSQPKTPYFGIDGLPRQLHLEMQIGMLFTMNKAIKSHFPFLIDP